VVGEGIALLVDWLPEGDEEPVLNVDEVEEARLELGLE
jgi:hypothetical protein